jgi:hypothetical protein
MNSFAVRCVGRRPVRVICAVAAVVMTLGTTVFAGVPAARGLADEIVRDEFPAGSYAGDHGTRPWKASWVEIGESDGARAGTVRVVTDERCVDGSCLFIGGDGVDIDGVGVRRTVDLSGATSARLSFTYRRLAGLTPGQVTVTVSGDGGAHWSALTTYALEGANNATAQSFDIGPFAGTGTTIRFLGAGGDVTGGLHVDDVEIAFVVDPPTTTSTTSTTTSSTTSTTTTTRVPSATTTTTTSTTTTTAAPSATSTTAGPPTVATTTTSPPRGTPTTTSTTAPSPSPSTVPPDSSVPSTTAAVVPRGPQPPPSDSTGGRMSPVEGLRITFTAAVEALRHGAASAALLGILIAILAVAGVERRNGPRLAVRTRRPG